jgi:putative sugar O-methyltransferase
MPLDNAAAHSLLKLMLEDGAQQDALHQPTAFWAAASEEILAELHSVGFESFRALSSTRMFFVPSYGTPGNMLSPDDVAALEALFLKTSTAGGKAHATLMQMLSGEAWAIADYRVYRAGDRTDVQPDISAASESNVGAPPDQVMLEGRAYSRSFLNYLHGLVFLKQHIDTASIQRVLEIGGGYGTLGEILHQSGGGYIYVDVDIPPTSAVSSYYLSQQPGLDLIDYSQTRSLAAIAMPKVGQQMVLCPWQLPQLQGSFDLFVNYISFQEMEPHVVQAYLEQVDRLQTRYVLLRNMREGKAKKSDKVIYGVETPMLGDDYDRQLPNYELIATNVTPYGYRTIDGYHSELRLYRRK